MMQRYLKQFLSFLLVFSLVLNLSVITVFAKPDWPSDTGIMAESGIIMDMDTGTVIFGQQIHVPLPPASITKLLTALIVAEQCAMDETVTFSHDAVYNVESGSGNKLSLEEGDTLTVEDCLYILLLQSSNQTANALAEHTAGSRQAFVDLMNEKIAELGCTESHFANPSGLNDDNQYVTAYDMAIIAAAAFQNEKVLEVSSSKSHSIPATINNPDGVRFAMEHRLLVTEDPTSPYYCEGALAGKTGYTSIAGNTLVTCAERDGRRIISVILRGTQPQYYIDAKTILDFGFSSFKNVSVKDNETFLSEGQDIQVQDTVYAPSDLTLQEDAMITLPLSAEFSDAERAVITDLPANHPQQAVAMLQYTYNDRRIGSAYLYGPPSMNGTDTPDSENGESASAPVSDQTEPSNIPASGSPSDDAPSKSFLLPAVILVILATAAGTIVFLFLRHRKKELEAMEQRRIRRRQRLMEIGYTEEEFEKLVKQRQAVIDMKRKEEKHKS